MSTPLQPVSKRKNLARIALTSLLLTITLATGCAKPQSLDGSLHTITKPYAFSLAGWELKMFTHGTGQPLLARPDPDGVTKVKQYFDLVPRISQLQSEISQSQDSAQTASLETQLASLQKQRDALTPVVETTIEQQIRTVLSEQGIYAPWPQFFGLKVGFPPVVFGLQNPLNLLVISPRDKIESLRTIMLDPNLTPAQVQQIENESDRLGVSSLVVEIGGFAGAYPTFVNNDEDLQSTIVAATHEWLHQYLAFRPLGFLYVLDLTGIARNYDIAQMNETVAGMLGDEIGGMVYQKYYAPSEQQPTQPPPAPDLNAFDFNAAMRQTRLQVDQLLAQGKVAAAEQYMEQERQFLATKGYYIRKLNQAYFAFYGTYGDSPTSVSIIGKEMTQLRSNSPSIKSFLDQASGLTNPQELEKLVSTR